MSAFDGAWLGLRRVVRNQIGFLPAMEWRNQLVMGPSVPGLKRFEDREVARAQAQLGPQPPARVACIVPTFQRPQDLQNAVGSILQQSFQDFVIMVVDDGAGLPALPDDPRLRAVSLTRNCGVAGIVRNVGIRATASEFVAFLDDDNTWRPEHLQTCVDELERGGDLVYTAIARYAPGGREIDVLSGPFDRRAFMDESWIDTSAIMVRRSPQVLFSRLPRGKTTIPGEDWVFVWRLSRRLRVRHVPVVTVNYLVNPKSFFTPWTEAATR